MSATEKELIAATAGAWVDGGGDSEGFKWCMWRILTEIKEIEDARKKETELHG